MFSEGDMAVYPAHGVGLIRITSYNVCYTKLLRYCLRGLFAGDSITLHDSAALSSAPGINDQHRIDPILPAGLVQQGNFDQHKRFFNLGHFLLHDP